MNEISEEEKALKWALKNGKLTPQEVEELTKHLETRKLEAESKASAMEEIYGDLNSEDTVDKFADEFEEEYLTSIAATKEQSLIIMVTTFVMATVFAVSAMVALNQSSLFSGFFSILVVFCSGLALLECLNLIRIRSSQKRSRQNALSDARKKYDTLAKEKQETDEKINNTEKLLKILREN